MKVDIPEILFLDFANSSMLFSLSRFAWEEKHRLFIVEDGSGAYQAWLDAYPEVTREEWELVTDLSIRSEALEPSTLSILLSETEEADWGSIVAKVPISDGLNLLRAQFEVFVENARNDRAFLMSMATPEQRSKLAEHEAKDGVRFNGAGGIGEMKVLLETERYRRASARYLTWVAHDSDALQPGAPSDQAQAVGNVCEALGLKHYMLERRAIENYLPLPSLEAWARSKPLKRLKLFRAYSRLSDQQRWHFNLKGGFHDDSPRAHEAGSLYDDLSEAAKISLATGFGKRIGELYGEDGAVTDEHFDLSRNEVQAAVAHLLGLLN
jgi:hypothetical protein